MANCADYLEDISALLDEELGEDARGNLEKHLVDCKQCANSFDNMKRLSSLVFPSSKVPEETKLEEQIDLWSGIATKLAPVCEVITEDLSAYLDGELPPAAQDGVKSHLGDCQPCLEKFNLLNSTNQLLVKGLELSESIDVDLWSNIRKRLTKDCEVIESELSSYLDQEVVTMRHRAITAHLIDCLACREKFEDMTRLGEAIRVHYKPEIPEDLDLWPGVKSKMRVVPFKAKEKPVTQLQAKPKRPRPRLSVIAAAAAAIVGFGSLAIWLASPDYSDFPTIKAEAYLIESSFEEPGSMVEAVVYEQ